MNFIRKEENLIKEKWYKFAIRSIKLLPIILAIIYLTCTITDNKIIYEILSRFGYTSILSWIFIWISSKVFNFCIVHRMPLYYIATIDLYDFIVTRFNLIKIAEYNGSIYCIITGIFIILTCIIKNYINGQIRNNKNSS